MSSRCWSGGIARLVHAYPIDFVLAQILGVAVIVPYVVERTAFPVCPHHHYGTIVHGTVEVLPYASAASDDWRRRRGCGGWRCRRVWRAYGRQLPRRELRSSCGIIRDRR